MTVRSIALALAALAAAATVSAEDADWYRGGWRAETGDPHIFQFVICVEQVSGCYCTHGADGITLGPLEGTFDEDEGIAFKVRHLNPTARSARPTAGPAEPPDGDCSGARSIRICST
jgi:hypothetical protein